MAKIKKGGVSGNEKIMLNDNSIKSTSIGDGVHCKPKNKHKKKNWKLYRGQGK